MIPWPFIGFTVVFAALVSAHFIFAYRSWSASRGEQPSDIDPHFVKLEDYFGRSFRLKVSEWLNSPIRACLPDGTLLIKKGEEQIRASGPLAYPPKSKSDDILVVRGLFECGEGCAFDREIYVYESAAIGSGTRMQSIAVDGDLRLGSNVRVARWVDSLGDLEIGNNCHVESRATAGRVLHLQSGAQVGSAFARTIRIAVNEAETPTECLEELSPKIEIPPHASDVATRRGLENRGVDLRRLKTLNAECRLYHGDLRPSAPLKIGTKLIVKGDCIIPAGSIVEGDLKAAGSIQVGAGSVCMGNVIADGDIWFGPSSRFNGIIHAGKTLRLGPGVRGGEEAAPVAAYAADTVTVEDNVVIHGKLASGNRVEIVADAVDASVCRKAAETLAAVGVSETVRAVDA